MKNVILSFIIMFFSLQNGVSTANEIKYSRKVYNVVGNTIQAIQNERNVTNFKYCVIPDEGRIETGWFRTHKGEVQLKVICFIRGNNYELIATAHNIA